VAEFACFILLLIYSSILFLGDFSGETAFKHMSFEFGWARFPMINRIKDLAAFISVSVVCGSRSFIDTGLGQKILEIRRGSFVEVHVSTCSGIFFITSFVFMTSVKITLHGFEDRWILFNNAVRYKPYTNCSETYLFVS
jgi:hypothetical protein